MRFAVVFVFQLGLSGLGLRLVLAFEKWAAQGFQPSDYFSKIR